MTIKTEFKKWNLKFWNNITSHRILTFEISNMHWILANIQNQKNLFQEHVTWQGNAIKIS
jgi:hypothetical protein